MDKLNYIFNHTYQSENKIPDAPYFQKHSLRDSMNNHFKYPSKARPKGWTPETDTFRRDNEQYKQTMINIRTMINSGTMTYGTPINQAVNTDDGDKPNSRQVGANNVDKERMARIQRENQQLKMKLRAKKFRQGMQRNQ